MYWSGARIGIVPVIIHIHRMIIRWGRVLEQGAFCVADRGTVFQRHAEVVTSSAWRAATPTIRRPCTRSPALAFGAFLRTDFLPLSALRSNAAFFMRKMGVMKWLVKYRLLQRYMMF